MEGNPPGLPWRRGAFPNRTGRTFWNTRKALEVAWRKASFQQRRIARSLISWQQLQLDLVSASTRATLPYTQDLPGYRAPEDPDDRSDWERVRERFGSQWKDCKKAFLLERASLREDLTDLTTAIEKLWGPLLERLERLDGIGERLEKYRRQIATEEEKADEGQGPSVQIRKEIKTLERNDPDLNWKQWLGDRPLTNLEDHYENLRYYAELRTHW